MEQPRDGLILFCKKDCATCTMIVPVMKELSKGDKTLTIFTQDDPGFPEGIPGVINDTTLEQSYHFQIETVPTLIQSGKRPGDRANRRLGPGGMAGHDRDQRTGRRAAPFSSGLRFQECRTRNSGGIGGPLRRDSSGFAAHNLAALGRRDGNLFFPGMDRRVAGCAAH